MDNDRTSQCKSDTTDELDKQRWKTKTLPTNLATGVSVLGPLGAEPLVARTEAMLLDSIQPVLEYIEKLADAPFRILANFVAEEAKRHGPRDEVGLPYSGSISGALWKKELTLGEVHEAVAVRRRTMNHRAFSEAWDDLLAMGNVIEVGVKRDGCPVFANAQELGGKWPEPRLPKDHRGPLVQRGPMHTRGCACQECTKRRRKH
jgi:hypothetical protein